MDSRDQLRAYVLHREELTIFDHDPTDLARGHDACVPRCKPIDRYVVENWKDGAGNPIVDPALLVKLRQAQIEQGA